MMHSACVELRRAMLTEEVGGPTLCQTTASGVLAAVTLDIPLLCAVLSGLTQLTMQGSLGVDGKLSH